MFNKLTSALSGQRALRQIKSEIKKGKKKYKDEKRKRKATECEAHRNW